MVVSGLTACRICVPMGTITKTSLGEWMVARVLDDDPDVLRRGIQRRLCGIAGTIGQRAEFYRERTESSG
jgi:hypothetical protein